VGEGLQSKIEPNAFYRKDAKEGENCKISVCKNEQGGHGNEQRREGEEIHLFFFASPLLPLRLNIFFRLTRRTFLIRKLLHQKHKFFFCKSEIQIVLYRDAFLREKFQDGAGADF
jgi:hypothetical protein